MITINATNVNDALSTALRRLLMEGVVRDSRNGPVLAFQVPVTTMYRRPTERVLFSPERRANHTFHLMESLWMLAGRNDVKFPATFVQNMKSYSDDGETFWGAYGYRWRNFYGYDQLGWIIDELKANPESRRCVLQMWNPGRIDDEGEMDGPPSDLYIAGHGGKDVPCNTAIYFDRRDGRLNMTVTCRSNDILWGCYGANAVHMSILHEYMASAIGCQVGWYAQMSNDLHLYTNVLEDKKKIENLFLDVDANNRYESFDFVTPYPLLGAGELIEEFDGDLKKFFDAFDREGVIGCYSETYATRFFSGVVVPMLKSWAYRKVKDKAREIAQTIEADDWRIAQIHWLGV